MIIRCALCDNTFNEGAIVTIGPCKDDPHTRYYHVGCIRQREYQIASSLPVRPTEEAGEVA